MCRPDDAPPYEEDHDPDDTTYKPHEFQPMFGDPARCADCGRDERATIGSITPMHPKGDTR